MRVPVNEFASWYATAPTGSLFRGAFGAPEFEAPHPMTEPDVSIRELSMKEYKEAAHRAQPWAER
jgi:hypothetical protein